ncbi:hypothetical protein [Nocardioides sp. KR10-350]|uniref:hypothetical protein n=1 Tax=Nocardioides cheoyonin TaxID=3156615 RepID=UPI0032B4C82E
MMGKKPSVVSIAKETFRESFRDLGVSGARFAAGVASDLSGLSLIWGTLFPAGTASRKPPATRRRRSAARKTFPKSATAHRRAWLRAGGVTSGQAVRTRTGRSGLVDANASPGRYRVKTDGGFFEAFFGDLVPV